MKYSYTKSVKSDMLAPDKTGMFANINTHRYSQPDRDTNVH